MIAEKLHGTQRPSKIDRGEGYAYQLEGTHGARCKREKHEDWQHGMDGCVVGTEKARCDCSAHWEELR